MTNFQCTIFNDLRDALDYLGKSAKIPYFCSIIQPAILAIMGDLIQEISKLSVNDRIQLVQAILQTIAAEQEPTANIVLSDAQKKK